MPGSLQAVAGQIPGQGSDRHVGPRLNPLSRRLRVEDNERRRIAQELHDTTVQDLIGIRFTLQRLRYLEHDETAREAFSEIRQMTTRSLNDLRTLSFLLYPPELEQVGLGCALSGLAQGLACRSGLSINVVCSLPAERFPTDVEMTFYRIAQEALTNVLHHAGASAVTIRLLRREQWVLLQVEDDGIGVDPDAAGSARGVGIRSMRARLRFLGGTLTLSKLERGTLLEAAVPLALSAPLPVPAALLQAGQHAV